MLLVHESSQCDVCLDSFSFERSSHWPHAIACGHVFCLHCLRHTEPANCPICRRAFRLDRVKRLHIQPAAPPERRTSAQDEEAALMLQRIALVSGEETPEEEVSEVAREVRAWLTSHGTPVTTEEDGEHTVEAVGAGTAVNRPLVLSLMSLLRSQHFREKVHRKNREIQHLRDSRRGMRIEYSSHVRNLEVEAERSQLVEHGLLQKVDFLEGQVKNQEDEISALRTQLASLQSQSTTTEPQARTNTSNNTPGGYNADHRALVHQHQRPSTRTRGFSTSTIPSTSTSTAFQPQPQPLPQLQLQLHQPQQTPLVASGLAHNPLPAPPEPVPDNRLPSFARSHTTPDVRSRSGERERHRHRDRHRSHGSGHRHVSGEARRGPRLTSDQQDPLRDQTSSSATRAPSGASSSAHAENTNTNHTPARTRPASMHVAPAYSSDSSQGHNTSSGSDPSAWFGGELPAWVTSSEVWRPHTEPMDENAVAESWAEWEAKHPHPPAVIDSDSEDDIVVLPARSLGADGDRAALSPNARNVPPGIRQGATSPSRKVVVDVSEALERRGRPRKQDNGPHAQQQELTREEQQQQQPSSQEFRPQAGYNSVPFDITILSIVGPNPNSNQHTVHWAPTPQQSLHGVSAIVPAPTPFADEEQLEQFDLLNGSEVRPHLSHDSPYHRGPVAIFAKGSDTLPRFHELMRDPTEERNAASTSTAHLNGLSNGQRRSSQDDSRLVQAAAFMSGFAEGEFEAQTQTQSERERDVLIGSTGRPAAMRVMPQPGQPQPMVNMSPASYASNATTTTVSLSTHSSWGEESTRSSHASSGATFDQFHLNALPTPELNGPAQIFSENQRTPMAFTRPLDTGGLLLVQGIAEPQPHRPVNNLSTSSTPSNSRSQNGVENTNGRRHASDGSHEAAARRRRSTSLSQTEESPVLQMQASYRRPALPTFDGFPNLQTSASDSVMQFQPFSPWPQGLEEGDMRTIRAPAPTSDEGARALRNWDLADH